MAQAMPQNYQNHRRFVPAYHFAAFGILTVNLLYALYQAIRFFSLDAVMGLLMAVAILLIFFHARLFALTVQDRVIRLEMRLRLETILPGDLKPRIPEFTLNQLIALRFAGDEELPELARTVLAENIARRDPIKKLIKNWNPDYLRA